MRFQDHLAALGAAHHLYANASNAFKDFLSWLRAETGRARPVVVMPSYVPAKLLRAALAAGCDVRWYEVHDACRVDLADVERQLDRDTIALFHVHYFGLPGEIDAMAALARRRGVALVEDCALSLAADHRGRPLGTFGDVALFSMRKMLLYPEGGALVVSDRYREFRPRYERRVSSLFSFPRFVAQKGKYAYVRLTGGADPLGVVRPGPLGFMDGQPRQTLMVKRLSAFSEARLAFVDLPAVVERRREHYRYLAERFPGGEGLDPLAPALPEGCTPYSFPFLVRRGNRDALRAALLDDGVHASAGWPEAPFDPRLARTRALAARLLELPVHHTLTRQQLDRALRSLERSLRAAPADVRAAG